MTTYTLDAQLPDGTYGSDSGLTAEQVANAKANAPRLGIMILAIVEDAPVTMSPEQVRNAFAGGAK